MLEKKKMTMRTPTRSFVSSYFNHICLHRKDHSRLVDEGETSSCQETRLHRTNENSFNKLKQKKKKSSQEPRGRSPALGNVSSLTLKMGDCGVGGWVGVRGHAATHGR